MTEELTLSQKLALVEQGLEAVLTLAGLDQNPYLWRDLLTSARKEVTVMDAQKSSIATGDAAYENLRRCCGYVQNGSQTTVTIGQDDATNTFHVKVGSRAYWGESLSQALEKAAGDLEE